MKNRRSILALLLCAVLVFSLFGCGAQPEQTQPPTTEPPVTEPPATEPPAADFYAAACAALEGASDLVLHIASTKTTTVGGESFTETSDQTLSMTGIGTDALKTRSNETVKYGDSVYTSTYTETFADGTLYINLDSMNYFSGAMTAEEISARYLPAVLLDAALYGSITWENDSTISFTAPTAAELWVLPEGAELVDASGSATLDASGALEETAYCITYSYGPAEITLDVCVSAVQEVTDIQIPGNAVHYVPVQDVDAVRLSEQATGYLLQAQTFSISSLESVMTYAGGAVRNQSTVTDFYSSDGELMSKVEINVYFMDYTTNQSQEYEQEELYRDGVYTVAVDGADPEEYDGVTDDTILEYCQNQMLSHFVSADFWQDAEITDLGELYLIECAMNEDFGEAMCDNANIVFWNNPDFLDGYASAYATGETSHYLAIDKYTGLPTSAGYYYEGSHTIDNQEYPLTYQSDQSITAPGLGAYHTITEEMLPEAEPETKAMPLFYHVTGEDGQEMWLLGTIHVGDERTAYLPQEIYDAFAASDALALEYDSKAFDEELEADDALQDEVSGAYYYSDGTTTADKLDDEELYETAVKYMKASGNYNMNAPYMKASIWSQSIENFYLRQGYHLTSEQGMESRLEKLAEEQDKEIRDVESGEFQVKMLTGWSDELQKLLLEGTLETSASEYWEGVADLYEKWCAGDETVMREELSDEVDTSELTEEELAEYEAEKHLYEEYNKAMSYDRNDGMLQVAIDYLESGDTVFYAVGLAHLLNDTNGLVDTLREAGYTVELVKYAE